MNRKLNLQGRGKGISSTFHSIKVLIYVVLLGSIFYWLYYVITSKKRISEGQREICNKYVNQDFVGIIDSIYDNFKVRNFHLRSDCRELSLWYYGNSYIAVGDSIVKKKGELQYEIYKLQFSDSVLVLQFSCD